MSQSAWTLGREPKSVLQASVFRAVVTTLGHPLSIAANARQLGANCVLDRSAATTKSHRPEGRWLGRDLGLRNQAAIR